jgi:hypothetical protein
MAKGDLAALARAAERIRPVSLAQVVTLPVADDLAGLLPDSGLRRGAALTVHGVGATTLAYRLVAAATRQGAWLGIVGGAEAGLGGGIAAAGDQGVALERVLVVPRVAPERWAVTVAACLDALDVVLVVPPPGGVVRDAQLRRLVARARERRAVLVELALSGPPVLAADVQLRVGGLRWWGLGAGHGCLRGGQATVAAEGRGSASRPRRVEVVLHAAPGVGTPGVGTPAVDAGAAGGPRLRAVGSPTARA